MKKRTKEFLLFEASSWTNPRCCILLSSKFECALLTNLLQMICLLSFNQAVQCTPHTVQLPKSCYLSHAYLSALQMGQYKFMTSKMTKTIIAFKRMDPKLVKLLKGNLFYQNCQIFGNLYQQVDVDRFPSLFLGNIWQIGNH